MGAHLLSRLLLHFQRVPRLFAGFGAPGPHAGAIHQGGWSVDLELAQRNTGGQRQRTRIPGGQPERALRRRKPGVAQP